MFVFGSMLILDHLKYKGINQFPYFSIFGHSTFGTNFAVFFPLFLAGVIQ